MTPIKIPGYTTIFGAPPNWDAEAQGECGAIAVRVGEGILETAWKPDTTELAHLNRGSHVVLTIWGDALPPASVNVAPLPHELAVAPAPQTSKDESLLGNDILTCLDKHASEHPLLSQAAKAIRELERQDALQELLIATMTECIGTAHGQTFEQRAEELGVMEVQHEQCLAPETTSELALVEELVSQCEAYHRALDEMFARLIQQTAREPKCFFPTESGQPWDACQKGHALIQRVRLAQKTPADPAKNG